MLNISLNNTAGNPQQVSTNDQQAPTANASDPCAQKKEQEATQTSERKREANRRNAKRSTGPTTERGKNTSRLNSVKHGFTARTIPLRDVPDCGTQEERDTKELVDDLWSSLRPQGRAQMSLVTRISRIYLQWKNLDRYEKAIGLLAIERELRNPTVEVGDPVDVEKLEKDCASVIERCKEELASNELISAELMEDLYPCVGPRRHYALEQLRSEIDHLTSLGEDVKEKNDGIDRLKEEFLAIVNSGVGMALGEARLGKQLYDEVARARLEQYLLPEEEDLRKILRYRSMLDRELSFCLDQLDRLQKKRRTANLSSNL